MLCPIKLNSNTIELIMHKSCYCLRLTLFILNLYYLCRTNVHQAQRMRSVIQTKKPCQFTVSVPVGAKPVCTEIHILNGISTLWLSLLLPSS